MGYKQTLRKVKALHKEGVTDITTLEKLMKLTEKKKVIDLPKFLELQDEDLPSAEVVIDVGYLPEVLEDYNEEIRFLPFEVWWGCVYPISRLFVLEFWKLWNNTTCKIFEMYLTPQDIKNLIEILQKGLEYLKQFEQDKQAE
jgi:hypothetical protein